MCVCGGGGGYGRVGDHTVYADGLTCREFWAPWVSDCIVLYRIVLYCNALYRIVLYCMVLHYIVF